MQNVVLAHGCWDVIHVGHIRHLREAKEQGDWLIVSVTSDRFVNKGADRPKFKQEQRMEMLRALGCVDEVVLNDAPDASEIIAQVKPAVYVKGIDYSTPDEGLVREESAVKANGGRLHITKTDKWSSSRIINQERYDAETIRFIEYARAANYRDHIFRAFDKADKMAFAFVGERIVDEYRYVRAIGKPSKEYTVATVETRKECFDGGVIAASHHGEFKNISVVCGPKPMKKTRYIDEDYSRKLFEIYSEDRLNFDANTREFVNQSVTETIAKSDAVIVFDFGHGLMDEHCINQVRRAKFAAVNAQSNAGNYGFNPVTRYKGADMFCVDDPEARLGAGIQHDDIHHVAAELAGRLFWPNKTQKLIVTHGKLGCFVLDGVKELQMPAFAKQAVDTMGAGDAFLAIAGPLAAAGTPLAAAAFAGNVAGAIKVSILGHRRHVGRQELVSTIESLLK